jgi:GntR family transcriptional regulator
LDAIMLLRIEPSSGIPITRQIIDQVRTQCVSRTLAPGDRLPSVRELARQLAVNQNTILRAYERLTAEGVLEMRHGEGTFVAAASTTKDMKRERTAVAEEAARLVHRALALGLSESEIQSLLADAIARESKSRKTGGAP